MTRALSAVFVLFVSTVAIAQDSADVATIHAATDARPYRDPQKARTLAMVLPGAGYVYTGEYFRGYGTWAVTAASFIWAPYLYEFGTCGYASIDKCTRGALLWTSHAMGALSAACGLWTWISSVRDAPLSAERTNERHRRREAKVHPILGINPQGEQRVKAGLSFEW